LASGAAHDRFTRLLALPFGLLCLPWLGPAGLVAGGLAFLIGGLWLSPDLDTRSRPLRRWGLLACIWGPYRHLVRHRGWISHTPLLGMACRLLYLGLWILMLATLLLPLGSPSPNQLLQGLLRLWQLQPKPMLAALLGLEASAWLHLIQDGDPLPPPLLR
jgi:uncharacterized metal-binding protein